MKHSRISQGSVESAAAEVAHPGYRMGDEEDGGDTLAYISRKSVKGKSVSGKRECSRALLPAVSRLEILCAAKPTHAPNCAGRRSLMCQAFPLI